MKKILILTISSIIAFLVISVLPASTSGQKKNTYIYLGQWEWVEENKSEFPFPFWRAPGGNSIGVIDLRSLSEQGQQGITEGYGIFAYATPQSNPLLLVDLGNNLDSNISDKTKTSLENLTKKTITSKTPREVIKEIISDSDPTGETKLKPIQIDNVYINDIKL